MARVCDRPRDASTLLLPRQVNDNVVQTLNMLKTSTGLDLEGLIKKSISKAAEGSGLDVTADGASPR